MNYKHQVEIQLKQQVSLNLNLVIERTNICE